MSKDIKSKLITPMIYHSFPDRKIDDSKWYESVGGLTFREMLIIALAGNKGICQIPADERPTDDIAKINAEDIIKQADAICKELENE